MDQEVSSLFNIQRSLSIRLQCKDTTSNYPSTFLHTYPPTYLPIYLQDSHFDNLHLAPNTYIDDFTANMYQNIRTKLIGGRVHLNIFILSSVDCWSLADVIRGREVEVKGAFFNSSSSRTFCQWCRISKGQFAQKLMFWLNFSAQFAKSYFALIHLGVNICCLERSGGEQSICLNIT